MLRFAALAIATGCAVPAAVTPLPPPAVGHISGEVKGDHEDPVAGVVVVVTATTLITKATTDDRGLYTIDGVPPGDHYAVTFYYNGATTRREGVHVRAGGTTPVFEHIDTSGGVPLRASPGQVPSCQALGRRDGICFP